MLTIEEYLERAKYLGRIEGMAETIEDEATRDGLYGDAEYLFGYLVNDATEDDNERNNAMHRLQQDVVEYAMVMPEPKHENTNFTEITKSPESLAEYLSALPCCPTGEANCPDDEDCFVCLCKWLKSGGKV